MVATGRWERRVSQDSPVLRVFLEVLESRAEATVGPPGTEASPASPVSLVCPGRLVFPERKALISPARFPESLENPVSLVSPDDQVLKVSLV